MLDYAAILAMDATKHSRQYRCSGHMTVTAKSKGDSRLTIHLTKLLQVVTHDGNYYIRQARGAHYPQQQPLCPNIPTKV